MPRLDLKNVPEHSKGLTFDVFQTLGKKNIILISLIFLGLIASTLVNGNYSAGLGIIKGWFIFPIILALIAKKELSREKIYSAVYLSGFITAALSLGYYLQGIVTFDGRLQGPFNSPNYLAMFLAPVIIIGSNALFTAFLKKTPMSSWLHILSLATILFAMYQTHSYASWASLAVIFLGLGMFYGDKKTGIRIAASVIFIAMILIFFQWQNKKLQDLLSFSDRSSLASRMMIWDSAEKILADNWFFGIGPGNFQEKYLAQQKNMPEPYLEWAVPHPHNLFLSFWMQSGLIGLLGFILLLAHWLKIVLRQEKSRWQLIAIGIMLYIILHGLIDTTYFKNDLAVLFWLNFVAILWQNKR